MIEMNNRCPLQIECGKKKCEYANHERDCKYYRANARPGMEISDQSEALEAEWENRMAPSKVLSGSTAPETAPENPGHLVFLPVSQLHPHPDNPRKDLGDLTELANSIKANGIYQNLTVIPLADVAPEMTIDTGNDHYIVIIGHRRLAAAKLAGLTEVPCVITEMDRREQVQTMLLENMQRSDLSVYEQAQGFQMMLDLGSTVEEIAQKSGFSTTTVRRRVKMMELDQDVLKQVSERQLSLSDFDRLAQIEDVKARNECLAEIGTSGFDQRIATILRRQTIKRNLPIIEKMLKSIEGKEIAQSDTWSGKYEEISRIDLAKWSEGDPLEPGNGKKIFYYLNRKWGELKFYQEKKRAKPPKKTAEDVEKQKKIAATWSELKEKMEVFYNLRSQFVDRLVWNRKNAETILRGALAACIIHGINYTAVDRNEMGKILGIDIEVYGPMRGVKTVQAIKEMKEETIPAVIYTMFNDRPGDGFVGGYEKDYPEYRPSSKLSGLYDWLVSLGYEMSDEEKALQDGTHELFHRRPDVTQTKQEEPVE